ncbi:hypothetical protein ABH931_003946 [Streptacidiphilus sp. MAP12-33]
MPMNRAARIAILVAEEAGRRGATIAVVDVCTAAVAALPVGGAGLSAMSPTVASYPLCSTDDISEQLEELQLTLGEGPCMDAFTRQTSVSTADLRGGRAQVRWPVFASAAAEAGAGAVYSFPLQLGAIRPGVLDLYAPTPLDLSPDELADAMGFADSATQVLLGTLTARREGLTIGDGDAPDGYRAQIDQASGMLTAQLGVGIEQAFLRLRAYAYAHGERLSAVAAAVVDRRLRFPPDDEPDRTA